MLIPQLTADDEFIVLACDGLYDVMSNNEIVTFVRKSLTQEPDLDK
jgi:serine/threonine protein phosphatase PrpC